MTNLDDRALHHLTNEVLVRAMDDELPSSEAALVDLHLSRCKDCRQRYQDLRIVSDHVESLTASVAPNSPMAARELLIHKLDTAGSNVAAFTHSRVLRRFGWGMAIAATLAVGVIFVPGKLRHPTAIQSAASSGRMVETFEVNGETFVALPYSNPDLPVSTSHVIEMQVPVSSLTDAGMAFEAVSAQQTALDHSVLADVLVGMDGQPLGVHVLNE